MLTNKNDRTAHRLYKDPAVTSIPHKKAPRLKNKKHLNCFPPPETPWKSKKTPTTLNMKSVSLVDIASEEKPYPKVPRKSVSREQGDDLKSTSTIEKRINNLFNSNYIFNVTSARENELAKYVCQKFILHTWRKGRAQTKSLQLSTQNLNKEVDNFKLQTCVLRTLVEADSKRYQISTAELNQTRKQLKEEIKTCKGLTEQLSRIEESFSGEKQQWQSIKKQLEERIESLTTELDITVKNSLLLNEKSLKYKQQLEDSKTTEVSLKDKLEVSQNYLEERVNELNNIKNKCFDLQMTVQGLVTRNQELAREKERKEKQISEYINNLKNLEVEVNNFQNIQKVQRSDIVKLRNECEELQTQITNKNLEIGCLHETVKLYEAKEKEIQSRIKAVTLRVFQLTLNLIPVSNYTPF